jgi:hypothetical protein
MEREPEFTQLAPSQKLLWWAVLSDFNLRGGYYRADLEYALMLNLSISTVRQARRKFQKLGWLKVTHGMKAHGRNLATTGLDGQGPRKEVGLGQKCTDMLST